MRSHITSFTLCYNFNEGHYEKHLQNAHVLIVHSAFSSVLPRTLASHYPSKDF